MRRFLLLNAKHIRSLEARRKGHPGKIAWRPSVGGRPLPPGARRVFNLSEITPLMYEDICKHSEYGNVQLLQVGGHRGPVDLVELGKELNYKAASIKVLGLPVQGQLVQEEPEQEDTEEMSAEALKALLDTMGGCEKRVRSWSPEKRLERLTRHEDGSLGWWFSTEEHGEVFLRHGFQPYCLNCGVEMNIDGDDDCAFCAVGTTRATEVEEVPPPSESVDLDGFLEIEEEDVEEDAEDLLPNLADMEDDLSGMKNRKLAIVLEMLGKSSAGKKKSNLVADILISAVDPETDPVALREATKKALIFLKESE